MTPALKQLGALSPADFEATPVWSDSGQGVVKGRDRSVVET